MPPTVTRAEFDELKKEVVSLKEDNEVFNELLILGNGVFPLKHVAKLVTEWDTKIKIIATLEAVVRWIENVNGIAKIIGISFIGIFIATGCSMFFGITILLYSSGLFKIP